MKLFQILLLISISFVNLFSQETVNPSNTEAKTEVEDTNASKTQMTDNIKKYYKSEKDAAVWYLMSGAATTAVGLFYRREYENYYPNPLKPIFPGDSFPLPYNNREKFPYMSEGNSFPYTTITDKFPNIPILNPEKKKGIFDFSNNGGPDFPHFGGKDNPSFSLGLSYPMIGIGLFHLGTGALMYFNSDKKERDVRKELDASPSTFKEAEQKRLDKISEWNKYFRYFNYSMIGGGVLAMYAGSVNNNEYMKGFGFGFLIQGAISYALDRFSSKRLSDYDGQLKLFDFQVNYIPSMRGSNSFASLLNNTTTGVAGEGLYTMTATFKF